MKPTALLILAMGMPAVLAASSDKCGPFGTRAPVQKNPDGSTWTAETGKAWACKTAPPLEQQHKADKCGPFGTRAPVQKNPDGSTWTAETGKAWACKQAPSLIRGIPSGL
jgi:hypothetical protein